jgi:hypothetical protein
MALRCARIGTRAGESERARARLARSSRRVRSSSLIREIGGPTVMRDQLAYLAAVSRRPNITVQIIPNMGAHPGLLGAFTVADLGGAAGIVNLEDIADGRC